MVGISDSDDDDLSLKSTQKRRQLKKKFQKKIEDSDTSSDENNGELSKNTACKKENISDSKEKNDQDEVKMLSNSVEDINKNDDNDCNDDRIEDSPMNDDSSTLHADIHNCTINDNSEIQRNEDIEHSYTTRSRRIKPEKKSGKVRNKLRCFNDSSSEEEHNEKTILPNDKGTTKSLKSRASLMDNSNSDEENNEKTILPNDKGKTKSLIKGRASLQDDSNSDEENNETTILPNDKGKTKSLKSRASLLDDSNSDEENNEKTILPNDKGKTKSSKNRDRLKKNSKNSKNDSKISSEENRIEDGDVSEASSLDSNKETNATNYQGDSDLEKKILEDDIYIENLMKNRDLFDAGESGSDDGSSKKEKGPKKEKRPTKDAQKEAKSEQQRLLRQQKFRLPYHIPEVKPLKDFLQRVPILKTREKKRKEHASDEKETVVNDGVIENTDIVILEEKNYDDQKAENIEIDKKNELLYLSSEKEEDTNIKLKPNIENLFKQKPKLSFGGEETIVFEESIELEGDEADDDINKKRGVLDSFMARFEKHTKKVRPRDEHKEDVNSNSSSIVNVVIPEKEKNPGGRRIAFAEQMKLKIRKERTRTIKELEKERKFLNEENSSEEEEEEEFEDEDDEEDDDNDVGEEAVDVDEDVDNDGVVESSEDEELEKWNSDDRRKALEVEMENEEKDCKISENNTNSVDFSIEGRKSPQADYHEKDDMLWDDTSSTVSSVLPAGQGDPTGRKNSGDGRMTPYSKLIKSGLLDSNSNLNYNSNSCSQGPVSGIALPCEDTQDLFKRNEKEEEESQIVLNGFQLNLDEESQYTQVIDSQGFFNDPKKSKRQLFDEDGKDTINDFSEVIGLCSGKFGDEESETTPRPEDEMNGIFKKDNGFSMTQVIGLCSGKFPDDDNAEKSIRDVPVSKPEVGDEGSMSTLPLEHPFSSRVNSQPTDQTSELSGGIFSLEVPESKSNLGKPLGLSNLMDDNFDDNAMDFCTAPFSGQTSGKESEDDEDAEEPSKDESEVASQTKFDVGNWLKKDKSNVKDSGSQSDGSTDEPLLNRRSKERTKRIEEVDDEDDVFADNEDDDDDGEGDVDDGGDEDDGVVSERENEEEEEVPEELLEYQDAIVEKKSQKKWSKNAFTEKEAELSGSDVGSDDEELGSEYDELEIDSDIEDVPTGEKLKDQVHKIHHKKVLDQDQREIRLLQELYIEDADGGFGKKRTRNFRWRNMADEDANLGVAGQSDNEEDALNLDNNLSQKLERAEREKYITELEEREKTVLDENSQSVLELIKDPAAYIADKPPMKAKPKLSSSKVEGRVLSQKRSGSFMSQTKSSFSHLSSAMKTTGQGGKSFVFQATEDENKKSADKENQVASRKSTSASEPAKKRAKFNSHVESSESQSIFDLL